MDGPRRYRREAALTDEPRTALGRRHAVFRELRRLGTSPLDGRKTFRVVKKRRRTDQRPPWRLRFTLPESIAFCTSPGQVEGVIAARVIASGNSLAVEVIGGPRQWVIDQGRKAAQLLGVRRWPPVSLKMDRGKADEGRAMRTMEPA